MWSRARARLLHSEPLAFGVRSALRVTPLRALRTNTYSRIPAHRCHWPSPTQRLARSLHTPPPQPPVAPAAVAVTVPAVEVTGMSDAKDVKEVKTQVKLAAAPAVNVAVSVSVPVASAAAPARLFWWWNAPAEANVGSVARDHLANERTFLAWSRTGLAFIGVGIGLNFSLTHDHALEIAHGITVFRTQLPVFCFLFTGATFVAYATARYFRLLRLLQRDQFQPNTSGVVLLVAVATCIVGGGLFVVLTDNQRGRHPRHRIATTNQLQSTDFVTPSPVPPPNATAATTTTPTAAATPAPVATAKA